MMIYYVGLAAPSLFLVFIVCQTVCACVQEVQMLHGYCYLYKQYMPKWEETDAEPEVEVSRERAGNGGNEDGL